MAHVGTDLPRSHFSGGGVMHKTVLVVEDDFLIAEDLRQTLVSLGWRVLGPAPSVRKSLELLECERPSVAVLDMHLLQEYVTPVATALREMGIPFIAASSVRDLDEVDPHVFQGIVNIGKPCTSQRLQQALLDAISGA
jgi:two-component system, response regulator PdtaR